MSVIIAAILLGIIQIITFVGFGWVARLYVERKQADVEQRIDAAIRAWTDQPDADTPSKLAALMDAAGTTIGGAAARSIMATLSAEQSHVARVANGAADVLQAKANPLLGLLTGAKRGKGAAVMRLAEMLGPLLSGGHGAGNHGATSEQSVRDRLQKG